MALGTGTPPSHAGAMLQPDLPLSIEEREEWGDPAADAAAFDAIRGHSPYDNLRAATRYPPMLLCAGQHDTRVSFTQVLRYLARLRLRTVVSLLPEPPSSDLVAWCHQHSIHLRAERVATFKDEVTLTHERVAQLLLLAVQPERQPVYVHCSSGVAVTGMLIMCLRKLQRWAPAQIYAEYSRFARDRGGGCAAPDEADED